MRTKLHLLFVALAFLAAFHQASAQLPVITSFSQNGQLLCANLQTGTVASVEWASSLSGPWNTNWAGLDAVTVNSNGAITVSVPMFYRVRGVVAAYQPTFTADGMALIPAGSFMMGNYLTNGISITNDPDIADANPTNIYLSAFYMDTNLVSYSQWKAVYNFATNHGYGFDLPGYGKATNHPVVGLDWYGCVKWCNARSQQTGLTPVYYTDAGLTQVYTNGDTGAVYVNWTTNGYRLPTEAEYEKAERGGLSGQRFPWGNTISENQSNYKGNTNAYTYDLGPNGNNTNFNTGAQPYTSPVGYFAPNGYGLYDMAGDVFGWCWDWYGTPYGQPTTNNPTGPVSGPYRMLRGVSWNDTAIQARCATRNVFPPGNFDIRIGFRCVRRP